MPAKDSTAQTGPRRASGMTAAPGAPVRKDRAETRRASRRTGGGQGFVRIPGYRLSLPCRIADVSATGARLIFADTKTHQLPDRIVVAFSDRTEVDAEIRWRKDRECGVRFLSLFRRREKPTPL